VSLRRIQLIREAFPDPPARDTAVSHAILRQVSDGLQPETLRLHRPGDVVAFGPKDRLAPGYGLAIEAARAAGFGSVQRLAGGRAAVFTTESIAFSWAIPDPVPRKRIRARFAELAAIVAGGFQDLGVDARVGEVPGEYCPGEHSVNARGRTKLMGVGQRLVQRAAHVGGVVIVDGPARVRDVLIPVYRALGLAWDPATVGSLASEVPGVTWESAEDAILARFAQAFELEEGSLPASVLDLAKSLEPHHLAAP
jgi:octanoyl-[GcvH]:protein N-octanoyltransferase